MFRVNNVSSRPVRACAECVRTKQGCWPVTPSGKKGAAGAAGLSNALLGKIRDLLRIQVQHDLEREEHQKRLEAKLVTMEEGLLAIHAGQTCGQLAQDRQFGQLQISMTTLGALAQELVYGNNDDEDDEANADVMVRPARS